MATNLTIELKLDGLERRELLVGGTGSSGGEFAVLGTLHDPRQELDGMVEVKTHVSSACSSARAESLGPGVLKLRDAMIPLLSQWTRLYFTQRFFASSKKKIFRKKRKKRHGSTWSR